ncbi:hypothetical protein GCM10010421_06330 [Streptomyces glaucus]|uniref:ABC transporter domain-containing protein n=1 Tax=Streptomyces glaucus TaxID=284029 RepID=A0ABN3J7T3_9ACTN
MAQSVTVTVTSLSFSWPDGTPVFEGLDVSFGPGRTGLVGVNGSGKSTLLKLIAGELAPADGAVRIAGEAGYLPQNVTLDTTLRVDEALGIAARRAALHAIEAGDAAEEHFETVGDDWDVEERALATLGELGLGTSGWTAPSARSPAASRCCCGWRRCCWPARTCCCSTSRPTTSTCTRAGGCTRPSSPGPG